MFETKVVEKIKTRVLRSVILFFFLNRAVYEIMWRNIVEPGRPRMTNTVHALCMSDNKAMDTQNI